MIISFLDFVDKGGGADELLELSFSLLEFSTVQCSYDSVLKLVW